MYKSDLFMQFIQTNELKGKKSLEDEESVYPEKRPDDIVKFLHKKYFEFVKIKHTQILFREILIEKRYRC